MSATLLDVRNLSIGVYETGQRNLIIDDVSLEVPKLSIFALVGGSGSGKTTTGLAVLRLLSYGLEVEKGQILFRGKDLLRLPQKEMLSIRGKEISLISQEPLNAFNPVLTIEYQIAEMMDAHMKMGKKEKKERIHELLKMVGLKEPRRIAQSYPHQLSGGQRQRAMIAQAISTDPKLLIADEPTSNLDVTLQARIMELFQKLNETLELSVLLITHDLNMVGHIADKVAVMHKGKVIEQGKTEMVMQSPQHPYTQELLTALKT